jgi:hypothetical protein
VPADAAQLGAEFCSNVLVQPAAGSPRLVRPPRRLAARGEDSGDEDQNLFTRCRFDRLAILTGG